MGVVRRLAWLVIVLGRSITTADAATLTVGPSGTYALPSQAIAVATPGDTIQIDAAGSYAGDTAEIYADSLTLQGVNGRPVLAAPTVIPNQKGVWVVYGNGVTVNNIEFGGAHLSFSLGANGAGIRAQGGDLTINNCYFHNNDMGILGPTSSTAVALIQNSEFFDNGDGNVDVANGFWGHNIYIGNIAQFTLQASWSHNAQVGHLVKSRAAVNYVLYNRLTDENGTASYECDFPNGGTSYVIGNIVQQGSNSQNAAILDYATEGVTPGYQQDLYVVNNSFVNDLGNGTFVQIYNATTPALIRNNVLYGGGTVTNQGAAIVDHNLIATSPLFVNQAGFDYHLTAGSPAIDQGQAPGSSASGYALLPAFEYVYPTSETLRTIVNVIDIGAYEYHPPGTATPTATVTATPSASATLIPPTATSTPVPLTPTRTNTPTGSTTPTSSLTGSATLTPSRTNTPGIPTATSTNPPLSTFTRTATPVASPTASAVVVSPNPASLSSNGSVTFFHLPPAATIRIYSVSGELVRALPKSSGGVVTWDLANTSGSEVAPAPYLWVVVSPEAVHRGVLLLQP